MSNIAEVIDGFGYEDITKEILRTMRRSAKDIVQLGYMLKRVAEGRIWDGHYDCLDDYLRQELRMDYSMATRFIKINETYANPYDGMDIDVKYQDYSQGALIEMLNMSEEQREQITPDMTVRQIREVKKKERQPVDETETEEKEKQTKVATSQDAKMQDATVHCAAYKAYGSCSGCYYDTDGECPYDRSRVQEPVIEGEYRELEENVENAESEKLKEGLTRIIRKQSAVSINGWIPYSERLPEDNNYILLSFENFTVPMIGRYEEDDNGGAFYTGDDTETCVSQNLFVNAWQPLPEPYRPKEDRAGMMEDQKYCEKCGYIKEQCECRKMTNGDRIRAMSDEELAMVIMCPNENGLSEIGCDHSDNCNCYECTKKWLQSEVGGYNRQPGITGRKLGF